MGEIGKKTQTESLELKNTQWMPTISLPWILNSGWVIEMPSQGNEMGKGQVSQLPFFVACCWS